MLVLFVLEFIYRLRYLTRNNKKKLQVQLRYGNLLNQLVSRNNKKKLQVEDSISIYCRAGKMLKTM